ncbi:MAG: NUDIX hydrolase [Candidatus Saccharimonadales bacterium]
MSKPKPWKKISSKQILDDPQLSINEDIVELPNGKRSRYVLHAHTDLHSVLIIAQNSEGKFLVQREYSYPPNEVMWQLPGGAMELGETVKDAALRELAEECGYSSKNVIDLGYFYVQNRKSNRKQYVVICSDLFEHVLEGDPDEFIELHWLTLKEIHEKVSRGEIVNINFLAALSLMHHNGVKA